MKVSSDLIPYLISQYNDTVEFYRTDKVSDCDFISELICEATPDANLKDKLTPEHIESVIVHEEYHLLGQKTTVSVLTLENGFEVIGKAGVIDPAKYDHRIGSEVSRKRAVDQIWLLEGYLRQQQIHESYD